MTVAVQEEVFISHSSITCDACSARAKSKNKKEGVGELYFCGHHTNKYRDTLIEQGWYVIEEVQGGDQEVYLK